MSAVNWPENRPGSVSLMERMKALRSGRAISAQQKPRWSTGTSYSVSVARIVTLAPGSNPLCIARAWNVRFEYRPVRLNTLTNEVQSFPPAERTH